MNTNQLPVDGVESARFEPTLSRSGYMATAGKGTYSPGPAYINPLAFFIASTASSIVINAVVLVALR